MKLGFAADHRGYLKKQKLIKFLEKKGYTIIDYGTNSVDAVDYPDYAFKVAEAVKSKEIDKGILMCANGIGMAIAANKVKTIRCAKVSTIKEAKHSRIDNDCNMIAISNEITTTKLCKILIAFLQTEFSAKERYIKRIEKVDNYEC